MDRSLVWCSPWGCRVRHDRMTELNQKSYTVKTTPHDQHKSVRNMCLIACTPPSPKSHVHSLSSHYFFAAVSDELSEVLTPGLQSLFFPQIKLNSKLSAHFFKLTIFILVFRPTYSLTPLTLNSSPCGILSTHCSRQTDRSHAPCNNPVNFSQQECPIPLLPFILMLVTYSKTGVNGMMHILQTFPQYPTPRREMLVSLKW